MARLNRSERIDREHAARLATCGCRTHADLLVHGGTEAGRRRLARGSGLPLQQIQNWVNRADLTRVKGIGEDYAELLHAAGVDTVPELSQRNPHHLQQALEQANARENLVRVVPNLGLVEKWIMGARALPRAIYH